MSDENFRLSECTIDPDIDPVRKLFCELLLELANQPWMPTKFWQERILFHYAQGVVDSLPQLKKIASKQASDSKYSNLRKFKENASLIACGKWEGGSLMLHHEMATFLEKEYKDDDGCYLFQYLPGDKKASPHKVLLETVKKVAKELGKFELISGHKK
jgi:hypothetical protein